MKCKDAAIQIDLYEFLYGWHGQKRTGVLEINPEIRSGRKGGRVSWKEGEGERRRLPGSPESLKERHDWKDLKMKKLEYLKLCKISKEATCPRGRNEWGSPCFQSSSEFLPMSLVPHVPFIKADGVIDSQEKNGNT